MTHDELYSGKREIVVLILIDYKLFQDQQRKKSIKAYTMHSHHSHSGDYIAHGVDPLEDVTNRAIEMKFQTYCLTEHMPRIDPKYLYPEENLETTASSVALEKLHSDFSKFLDHAQRIKSRPNAAGTKFLIGVEIEGCDTNHVAFAKRLLDERKDVLQFSVASVHHVNEIPIDFDPESWLRALKASGNNLKDFLLAYFELQYEMLIKLQPAVVGHFDLYKLYLPADLEVDIESGLCDKKGVSVSEFSFINSWKPVRDAVIRNLKYIKSYGGAIEINTSALRKKLQEPYPGKDIGDLAKQHAGGRFVLSDDAHGVSQVGVCYDQALDYIVNDLKLDKMYYLDEDPAGETVMLKAIPIDEFKSNAFWSTNFSRKL